MSNKLDESFISSVVLYERIVLLIMLLTSEERLYTIKLWKIIIKEEHHETL